MPVLALTTSMAKSGEWPVRPKMVVLRYLWWPHRSMRVMILLALSMMSSMVRDSL